MSIDNKMATLTSSTNPSAQFFEDAHGDKIYVCIFIGVSAPTNLCLSCNLPKTIKHKQMFLKLDA